jgi:hypothetical protein
VLPAFRCHGWSFLILHQGTQMQPFLVSFRGGPWLTCIPFCLGLGFQLFYFFLSGK